MKTKSLIEKKLVLNKISIARLDNERLVYIKGGSVVGYAPEGDSVSCQTADAAKCLSNINRDCPAPTNKCTLPIYACVPSTNSGCDCPE
jgi:hypothetical protein